MDEKHQPSIPYLLFHPQFIIKNDGNNADREWGESVIESGLFENNSFAIDIKCRKFALKEARKRRSVYALWNFPFIKRENIIYVDYIFGQEQQLTFEQAREEFVEYVCSHRWWSASYENEQQFRERNLRYSSMAEMMEPVYFKGRWPRVKRNKR